MSLKARVSVVEQYSGKRVLVVIPVNATAGQLLPYLVKDLQLPKETQDGSPIKYWLIIETLSGTIRIEDNDILADVGVQDGTILRIAHEIKAKPSLLQMNLIREYFERQGKFKSDHIADLDSSALFQLWERREKSQYDVKIFIIDYVTGEKEHVELSVDVTPKRLLPYLVKGFQLPEEFSRGIPGHYILAMETDTGFKPLQDNIFMAEAGVRNGSILVVMPETGMSVDFQQQKQKQERQDFHEKGREENLFEEWNYLDFELQLIPARAGYQVEVLSSPAGEASDTFRSPDMVAVENFILRVSRTMRGMRSVGSPAWDLARDFGKDLFNRLFSGEILARLTASMREAQNRNCGLRLKLRLDHVPELMNIPWEFLYYQSRKMFLAPQEEFPIVRFLSTGQRPRPMFIEYPLRILAMTSSPTDLVPLNITEERNRLEEALESLVAEGRVNIDWIPDGNMQALYNYLARTREDHHIFHFIGHGGFDEHSGEGYLYMEGAGKHAEQITGERLAPLLSSGKRQFRLALLNTCEGGRTSVVDPFAGMATSLMLVCNLSAVVAMQFAISDRAAITFASSFYGALATGRPVDTAVTNARLAIYATHSDVEWGTPVLYMRSPDGKLFDFSGR